MEGSARFLFLFFGRRGDAKREKGKTFSRPFSVQKGCLQWIERIEFTRERREREEEARSVNVARMVPKIQYCFSSICFMVAETIPDMKVV